MLLVNHGCLIETFSKNPDHDVYLIETVSKLYINKTVRSIFSEIISTGRVIETFEKISDHNVY